MRVLRILTRANIVTTMHGIVITTQLKAIIRPLAALKASL